MNIKKYTSNKRLLSVDDPSIYYENTVDPETPEQDSTFIRAATAASTAECVDTNTLYLIQDSAAPAGTYVPYVKTGTGAIERLPNPFNKGPTLPYPDAHNLCELNDNLVAIDNHLYALRKELSYWNLYEIAYSVEKTADFSSTLASLAPGEALIINMDNIFEYEGQRYKRGDIIVRLTNGTYVTIESSMAGFYYPSKILSTGTRTYQIYYQYHQTNDIIDDATALTSVPLATPHTQEYYNVESADPASSHMYGLRIEVTSGTTSFATSFASHTYEGQAIPPVIKMFNSLGEEIWLDFTCNVANDATQYTLTIPSKPKNWTDLRFIYVK